MDETGLGKYEQSASNNRRETNREWDRERSNSRIGKSVKDAIDNVGHGYEYKIENTYQSDFV